MMERMCREKSGDPRLLNHTRVRHKFDYFVNNVREGGGWTANQSKINMIDKRVCLSVRTKFTIWAMAIHENCCHVPQ